MSLVHVIAKLPQFVEFLVAKVAGSVGLLPPLFVVNVFDVRGDVVAVQEFLVTERALQGESKE